MIITHRSFALPLAFATCIVSCALACPSPTAPSTAPSVDAGAMRTAPREPIPSLPTDTMIETMVSHSALQHPRVVPYLHLEIPANVPVKLFAGPDLARGAPNLQLGGTPVVIVHQEDARVVLESRERLDAPATYRIHLRIPPEGVAGHVDVALRDNVWTAVDAHIVER